MTDKPYLSLILPAYNEAGSIIATLNDIQAYLDREPYSYEIIVAADGDDGTRELVGELAAKDPRILVIGNPGRHGKGKGIRQGVQLARGEIVGFADADNKTPIDNLARILPWFDKNFDVVIGSRRAENATIDRHQSLLRRVGSKGFAIAMHTLVGLWSIRDTQCGFKFFRGEVARKLFKRQRIDGYMFDVEILRLAESSGYSIKEVGVGWRDDGDSRLDLVSGNWKNLVDLFRIRFGKNPEKPSDPRMEIDLTLPPAIRAAAAQFPWPTLPGDATRPTWTGRGFKVGQRWEPILGYSVDQSGWTDDLTTFHEENAGADHFIDRASRQHAVEQVAKFAQKPGSVVLEVGCSSGYLLADMQAALPEALIIGSDYVRGPVVALSESTPTTPLMQFDITNCPLPDNCVDVVVALNVLEHIEDHAAAVREMARILKPGGAVVLEVPAGPNLYDVYDKQLMHFRRYRQRDLRQVLEAAKLNVTYQAALGTLLYPAFWLVKQRNKRYLKQPDAVQKQIVAGAIQQSRRNRLCEALMAVEKKLRRVLPNVGIRCLATSVKPRQSIAAQQTRKAA